MEAIFVYGTLQDPRVQKSLIGRTTAGEEDILQGYRRDDERLAPYPVAVPDPNAEIPGRVLYVTADELQVLDAYEGSAYRRISVQLHSGLKAWVYCLNNR